MRYLGPYDPARIPSVADLLDALAPDAKSSLRPLAAVLGRAEQKYAAAIPNMHNLPAIKLTVVQKEALKAAYKGRSNEAKKLIEDMVGTSPRAHESLCPFCSMDTGPALDHWLPQATHPEHCFNPRNLVPICGPCNNHKGTAVKDAAGDRIVLYPLHDAVARHALLTAEVSFIGTAHARYSLDMPPGVAKADFDLVGRHFARLQLASRLSRRANGKLAAIKLGLGGKTCAVIRKTVLGGWHDARRTEPPNSWQTALYRHLAADLRPLMLWLAT